MSELKGVIAAGAPETVEAGVEMLKMGGNAVDAAVAAAFASFVSEIMLVNVGAGGIATLHLAKSDTNIVYDFFSDMPSGKFEEDQSDFREVWVDYGPTKQPFYIGRASVAVPGVVAGLCTMATKHGRLPLATLLKPSIRLAQQGVILSEPFAYMARILTSIFMDTPKSAEVYGPTGKIAQAGERVSNPALGKTFSKLGQLGQDYFYRGELAQQIIADQEKYGGLITAADLANYQVHQVNPIAVEYKEFTILFPPPSSIGGLLIAFTMKLLGTQDFSNISPKSSERLRILAEAMRLTNFARKDFKVAPEDIKDFLAEDRIQRYHEQLNDILAGATPPFEPVFPPTHSDTTHLSVMDNAGNLVSITTSAGEGAGFMVGDTGVALNNMLGEADIHPDGFHLATPGVRLQTMMSPTIVLKKGKPVLVLGSGGSTRLRSAIVQVLSNTLDYNMHLDEAVNLPRIHFEHGILQLEGGIPASIGAELTQKGYQVNAWPAKNMFFGGVHSVGKMGSEWVAVGDPRRSGYAAIVD